VTDESNPWVTLSSRRCHEDRFACYEEDTVRHRSGRVHPYTALRYKTFGIAVAPISADGQIALVGQYRYVIAQYSWEVPRGCGQIGDDPFEVARRELLEETGFRADHLVQVLGLRASLGISDEQAPCFVAWGLRPGEAQPDPEETVSVRMVPFSEAVAEALSGAIVDAPSVALLLALSEGARRGRLAPELTRLIRLSD
jgi:8-oxo-dGTP pyrophosphatase MutT (NUDIX family)